MSMKKTLDLGEALFWGFVIIFLLFCAIGVYADAAEPFRGTSTVTVDYEVPDIPKLEAKAIEILRRPGKVTGVAMTPAQARAITRPNGVVDVARCWEYVSTDRLLGMAQARVVHVTVAGEHP